MGPDVALVDLWMPGTDGFALARLLRERPGPTPLLIAVTGVPAWACPSRVEAAGFDHFLTKPVNPDALLDCLRRHAGRHAPAGR